MKTGKKVLSVILAVVLVFALSVPVFAESGKNIVILYTNDVHCAADDNMGYAGLAAYKAEVLKSTDYVTLADAGDAIQGGVLGTLSKGSYIIDIMNQVGYGVATPGNHEFDYGMSNFLNLSKALKCGYVCCNFMDLKTGKPVFDSYKMITYGNTKVAYVGIDTPESISKSTPAYFEDASGNYIYGFCSGNNGRDLYDAVQKAIDSAKANGANYVIAVGHCGIDEQSAPWRSTDIIQNVSGLAAFIDGHSHSTIPEQDVKDKNGKNVVLTSSGTKLAAIGKLVIGADGSISSGLVTNYKDKDSATTEFINGIKEKNKTLLNTIVAKSDTNLTTKNKDGTRAVRSKETNLGDLAADAFRIVGKADIGIINGGGIRADIASGDITYGDIVNVFPFNNSLCVAEATGQQIIDALEMSARVSPSENGGFLQVSGLTYTIDTTLPSTVKLDDDKMFLSVDGARRVGNVQVLNSSTGKYEPIVLTKMYTVASYDYMLKSGGDGMNIFKKSKLDKDCTMLDNQVLINYITDSLKGTIPASYASSQGRINVKYKVSYLYNDVADNAWYESFVQSCYDKGIMNGIDSASFAPDSAITRASFVTMLYRFSNSPEVTGNVSALFSDCRDGEWYSNAVIWASKNKIAEGTATATFNPMKELTRQEMAEILYNYAVYRGTVKSTGKNINFADGSAIANWAQSGVAYCTAAGIMNGVSDDIFNPNGTASRAMAAAVISRIAA